MNLKIIDYDKKYDALINKMEIEQWNSKFVFKDGMIVKIALVDDEFAGVAYGWAQNKNTFLFDTVCIMPEFQRHGVGRKISTLFVDEVKNLKPKIRVELLDNGIDGPRSKRIFEHLGFKYVKFIPNFFRENEEDYCPDCKSKPCSCSAWIYELQTLNSKKTFENIDKYFK